MKKVVLALLLVLGTIGGVGCNCADCGPLGPSSVPPPVVVPPVVQPPIIPVPPIPPTEVCTTVTSLTSLTPTPANFPNQGGEGRVQVTAPEGCSWTVSTNVPWILLSGIKTGTGIGVVAYTTLLNSDTGSARFGSIFAGNQILLVKQDASNVNGPPPDPSPTPTPPSGGGTTNPPGGGGGPGPGPTPTCTFTVPGRVNIPYTASSVGISIVTQPGCSWTASGGSKFLTGPTVTSGTGSKSTNYFASQNNELTSRSVTVTVAGVSVTVNQAGRP